MVMMAYILSAIFSMQQMNNKTSVSPRSRLSRLLARYARSLAFYTSSQFYINSVLARSHFFDFFFWATYQILYLVWCEGSLNSTWSPTNSFFPVTHTLAHLSALLLIPLEWQWREKIRRPKNRANVLYYTYSPIAVVNTTKCSSIYWNNFNIIANVQFAKPQLFTFDVHR